MAVTALPALMTSTHCPVPVQPPVPLQPVKTEVAFGVAVSVTVEPLANSVQVAPQLTPTGSVVTAPPPVPANVRLRFRDFSKSPVTDLAESIVTTQVGVRPEQPPPVQPLKMEPPPAVAVSVTVPTLKLFTHANGQLMPAGELTMPPDPRRWRPSFGSP